MRHLTISVLSVFVVLPSVAIARLPVVNLSSGSVSARAAFGEEIATPTQKIAATPAKATRKKTVVARSATKPASVAVDSGAQIVASNDVLVPRRPSNDLWAKNDSVLRMPLPNEFSVLRNDGLLPEESVDRATSAPVAMASAKIAPAVKPVATDTSSASDIDAQIARLVELQKRASDSVRTVSPRVIAAPIAETKNTEPVSVASVATAPVAEPAAETVSLRRMVVPMTSPDVVVRAVEKNTSPRIVSVRDDMTKMSPSELRRAFRKTFLSENKHLSTFAIDDRFDVASDMSSSIEGFTAQQDLSEGTGIRPLEIKIKFRNEDSALSRENYTLLTEYAGIVVNKPTRAIQIAIPQYMTKNKDERKLAARRLAIVEQVLTDNGVSQQRIVPVLSSREESGFVLRIISSDQYETLTQQQRDIFGDTVNKKSYKSMTW
ncbi:MAG: hypothetical protein IJX43_02865 [Alphaproteobacteria bacterium]|nr:hypothetical protein [Alphaproteobacteria bacterium]